MTRARYIFVRNLIKGLIFLSIAASAAAQTATGTVEGKVSNPLTGSPVRKALIRIGKDAIDSRYQATTDANGRYSISGIAPGKYHLWVQRPGLLPTVYGARGPNRPGKFITIAAGETKKDINVLVEAPAVITGHIYDEEGEPLSVPVILWHVIWRNGQKTMEQAGGGATDDEGAYRLYGLPAGTYLVSTNQTAPRTVTTREVYPLTFYPGSADALNAVPLRLAPGSEAIGIDLHLRKTVAINIRGLVTGAVPGQQFTIAIERRDAVRTPGIPSAYTAGDFTLSRIVPGSYTLTATSTANDKTFWGSTSIDVGTLDMDDIRIAVRQVTPIAGKTAPGISLQLSRQPVPMIELASKPDGTFLWPNPRPGKWTIEATHLTGGQYQKSPREIEIAPDFTGPLEVAIGTDGAEVKGSAAEAETILLLTDGKLPHVVKYAIADADGKYELHGIPPGKYRILALDDIETLSWEDPAVANGFEGQGVPIELAPAAKVAQDLHAPV
jgi:large repetitive protein